MDLGNAGLTEASLVSKMEVYPNPAVDMINIEFELENALDARINIFDAYGKMVGTVTPTTNMSGAQKFTYNTKELEGGMYFVSVISDKGAVTERFQVIR